MQVFEKIKKFFCFIHVRNENEVLHIPVFAVHEQNAALPVIFPIIQRVFSKFFNEFLSEIPVVFIAYHRDDIAHRKIGAF